LLHYCPVCNGIQSLEAACPKCNEPAVDYGRFDDLLGPYAPYREIEAAKLTNGFDDASSHRCVHAAYCSSCGSTQAVAVNEWPG